MQRPFDVAAVRRAFPGLSRAVDGRPAVFFDGPAGSQVPASVAAAVADYLLHHNANHGGPFATSRETDAMTEAARGAFADLFGAGSPDEIVFGPNMTTLTLHVARCLARTWRPGDEVLVTDSDHDANVMPWVLAARDAGAVVRRVAVRPDGTLDLESCERQLSARTRLFAFGAASNLTGTVHPVARLAAMARRAGALSYVDAVHYAPHARMDVNGWDCDFAVCSAYKFFGPHLGVLFGRRDLLERVEADKVRPAPDHGPEKWQTGTAAFESIAGGLAAVDYLAGLGGPGAAAGAGADRRARLDAAFAATAAHERALAALLLAGLAELPVRVIGIADPARLGERVATVSIVPEGAPPEAPAPRSLAPQQLSAALGERGVFSWAGNSYAVALTTALGLEPHGVLRLGMLHYNTPDEVRRCLGELRTLLVGSGAAKP